MNPRAPAKPGSIPATTDAHNAKDARDARDARKLRIPIKKGHVRRAMRLAEAVNEGSRDDVSGDLEPGLVLMTAVLLVERLAGASGCPPTAVLDKMADCFALKRAYAKTLKFGMPS